MEFTAGPRLWSIYMLLRSLVPGVVWSEVPDFDSSSALPAIGECRFPDHLITHRLHGNPLPRDGIQASAVRVRRNQRRYSQDDLSCVFSFPRQKNLREKVLLTPLCPKHIVKVPIPKSLSPSPTIGSRAEEGNLDERDSGFHEEGTPLGEKSERSW